MALGFAGFAIMRRAKDRFGFLLAFSLTTYIILQAAMNVAVKPRRRSLLPTLSSIS